MSLDDAMDYLKDTVRKNHGQRDKTLEEMTEMFDYMVNEHMEYLHRYSVGLISRSGHGMSVASQWKSSVIFMNAISAQIMLTDKDQKAYTRRGDAISKWAS